MVGGQEQKHSSPLGNELYFDANLAEKFLLSLSPTWPPCHVVANQELRVKFVLAQNTESAITSQVKGILEILFLNLKASALSESDIFGFFSKI